MKTRGIIGKRIVAIKQYRPGNQANVANCVAFSEIELEGGIKLRPLVIEGEPDYHIKLIRVHPNLAEGGE